MVYSKQMRRDDSDVQENDINKMQSDNERDANHRSDTEGQTDHQGNLQEAQKNESDGDDEKLEENCWLEVNVTKHFEIMDALDEKHRQVRESFQDAIADLNLDNEMTKAMVESRAAAERAIYNAGGVRSWIPAGINLGGYGMIKLDNSMLFFHRMKLRNQTEFKLNYLSTDVMNMVLTVRLSLNDLYLRGQYERAITDKDTFFYRPTFGELELLLKGAFYKIEGRLRLVQSRLMVEHVLSNLNVKEVLMMYYVNGSSNCQTTERLLPTDIVEYLERLQADLDSWMKDYFNDYLLFFGLSDAPGHQELHCYNRQKEINFNDFMDHVIKVMHNKLYSMKPSAANVKVPDFSIFSVNGVQVKLHSGVIRGMDSFYRQSVATGRKGDNLRMVDAVIGFSKLKLEYKYLAKISGRTPPLMGLFVLTADDLIAHLKVIVLKETPSVDVGVLLLRQVRPQFLVIEGAINRLVGNFKHVVETEIITLMTNTLMYNIKQLSTLSRCEPNLRGFGDDADKPGGLQHHDDSLNKNKPDYSVNRNDSIELEVPGDKKRPPKKMSIKFSENLAIAESDNPGGEVLVHSDDKANKPDTIVHNEMTDTESKSGRRRKNSKTKKLIKTSNKNKPKTSD